MYHINKYQSLCDHMVQITAKPLISQTNDQYYQQHFVQTTCADRKYHLCVFNVVTKFVYLGFSILTS